MLSISAVLSASIDEGDDYGGILALDASPGVSGTVILSNAVFVDTGANSRTPVSPGARLAIIAVPPGGSIGYRVSASSSDLAAPASPTATVSVYSTPGAQTLVASGSSAATVPTASASDLRDRRIPSLATSAQSSAEVDATVIDTAVLVDVPSSGVQLRWSGHLQPRSSPAPQFSASTLVFELSESLTVTAGGVFLSELFPVTDRSVGTVFWVATVVRNGTVLAEGRCGDSAETTVVTPPAAPLHLPW